MRWSALGLLVVLLLSGCKSRDCQDATLGEPVDPVLMSFIGGARAAHHLADGREQGGDLPGAEVALEKLVDGPLPPRKEAAEVREVLADTRARLADLRSRHGDFEKALRDLEAGLRLVPEPSYFRGHLYETRGIVEERQTQALTARGDPKGAALAKERALSAFEEALRIQQAVIQSQSPKR